MQSQLVSELERLQQLYASGFLSEAELAQAKAKLLGDSPTDAVTVEEADAMLVRVDQAVAQARVAEQRATLAELRGELTRREQRWQSERESHLVRGRYGNTSEPTRGGAVASGIGLGVMAVFCFVAASNGVGPAALMGIFLLVVALFAASDMWSKAEALESAQSAYERDRERIQTKIREAERRK